MEIFIQEKITQSQLTATASSFWTFACARAKYACEHGKLPPEESDASASDLSEVLSDIGKLDVDSISTTRVIDDASWEFVFKRQPRSYSSLPMHPPS